MTHKIKYIAVAILALFTLQSCDDFLTQGNPNENTTDQYWKNLKDCESGLISVYASLRHQNTLEVYTETLRSDLGWPGFGRPNLNGDNGMVYAQNFTNTMPSLRNKWDNLYKGIFRSNQVIAGLNGIREDMETEEDIEKWTLLMGEARFFRGLFHFWVHNSFNKGEVIMYDFVPETQEDFYQHLQKEEVVRAFFTEDLVYAYENLPFVRTDYSDGLADDPQAAARASKGAAAMALAQSYLYIPNGADYEMAAVYLKDIIENGPYDLVDVSMNMTTNGEFNQESIFEISYDTDLKTEETNADKRMYNQYGQGFSGGSTGGFRTILPSCWLAMAFKEEKISEEDPRNKVINDDGFEVTRNYSLRASHSIAFVDDLYLNYYGDKPIETSAFNNLEFGYFRKNSNWDIVENENDLLRRSGVNFRLMRLADVYLMYAECLIEGGNNDGGTSEAIDYINLVRDRSALELIGLRSNNYPTYTAFDEISYDATMLMDHLMYIERPLELCLEGHAIRQRDLTRWGIAKERFQFLSRERYHTAAYTYGGKTKYAALERGANPGDGSTLIDFEQAAQNYIKEIHAYWPISVDESQTNPNVD